MKLLSVVVPVYNVEEYIAECVKSICGQDYKNLEIILVDDGSTDKSGEICDLLAKTDSRIVVIHTHNAGVSNARNTALDNAHGEYITLVDSDDYVLPEGFSVCIENLEKYNLDGFHMGHFRKGNGDGGSRDIKLSLEDEYEKRLLECINGEGTFTWGWVVKKKVWDNLRYPLGKVFEDGVIAPYVMERLYRVGSTDRELYYYRRQRTGICYSSRFKPKSRFDHVYACKVRLEYAKGRGFDLKISRANLLVSLLKYLNAYYAVGDDNDRYNQCISLIKETKKMPFDINTLGVKYRLLLFFCDGMNGVNKFYAKASLWLDYVKRRLAK